MSVSGSSDYIDQYGMTGEAYSELTDAEQIAVNDAFIASLKDQGKSDEEIAEALSELKTDLEVIQEIYEDYIDELKDLQSGNLDDDEEVKIDDLIDSCNKIIDEAEEAEEQTIDDSYDTYTEHNKTYGTGEDASITDLTLDGGTYTYEMSGGNVFIKTDASYHWTVEESNDETGVYKFKVEDENGNYCYVEFKTNNVESPFGDDATADADYLVEEGVTNEKGEVISDYNLDGFMNQADMDDALEARDGSTLDDSTTDFYFSTGITSDDLDAMKGWPEGLLRVSYWGDSTTSFYEELYGKEEEDNNLSIIAGYDDAKAGLSEVSPYADGPLSDLQDEAELALQTLFGYINDPTAASITDVWADIFDQLSGLSEADQALIIQYLTLTVATNAKDQFATLFGSVVMTLENMLDYESDSHANYTTNDKIVVLLLENLAGGGNYGGASTVWSTVFSADGTKDGEWTNNNENVEAIEQYMEIISLMGGILSGVETKTLDYEKARLDSEEEVEEEGGTVVIDDNYYNTLYSNAVSYGNQYGGDDFLDTDGIKQDELKADLQGLFNTLHDLGEVSVDELCNAIQKYISNLPGEHIDDVACTFLIMIKETNSELYKQLIANSELKSFMKNNIDNGANVPDGYDKLENDLGLTERSVAGDG